MLPVPRFVIAWLIAGARTRRAPVAAATPIAITAVAFGPDRFTLSLDDDATGRRREIDCLHTRPWLSPVLAVLGPVLRFAAARGRLRVRPHPFGVLFALDALIHLGALSRGEPLARWPLPVTGAKSSGATP